jgi:hypothetical protein
MSTWKHRAAALLIGSIVALALVGLWLEPTLVQPARTEAPIATFEPSELATEPWASSPEGLDFLEAAFRFQFKHNDLNRDAVKESAFVFLALEGPDGLVDPPPALLARLDDYPNITRASEAVFPGFGRPEHRELNGAGVLFVIENVRLIDESTIEVSIRYQGGCSSGNSYRFERRAGRWVKVSGGTRYVT